MGTGMGTRAVGAGAVGTGAIGAATTSGARLPVAVYWTMRADQ